MLLFCWRACVCLFTLTVGAMAKPADFEFNAIMQQAYNDILSLRIEPGRKILIDCPQGNGLKIYLENYADIATLLVTEDPALFKKTADNQAVRLKQLENMDETSPYQRFLRAEVHLHWAFVKLKFGKELAGCWDIIRAYRLLDENAKMFPQFIAHKKSLGLLHVLIGATPKNYQWVPKLLGLRGNIEQGLAEIRAVVQKDKVFGPEAQLINFLLHSYIISMNEATFIELERFVREHPYNLLFHLFGASMLVKNNASEKALAILQHPPTGEGYLIVPSLAYLTGEAQLQKGQYDLALGAYQRYLRLQKGHNFLKDSYYKIFLAYWLQNQEAAGKPHLEKLLLVGKTITEPDKAAEKFARQYEAGFRPNAALMRARLHFDGGFYSQAQNQLKDLTEADFAQAIEKAEFHYRRGRILQKTNQIQQAIGAFERAIMLSDGQVGWPFGANSCLQLGYLYQAKNQFQKAKYYFEKALDYPPHEYKNSVENKAKAALNKLEKEI